MPASADKAAAISTGDVPRNHSVLILHMRPSGLEGSAMYPPLNDPHFVFLILASAAVVTIGALVTALNRAPRADFARLQNELKELSERVKVLEMAEQRRFTRELKSP
jgi:hypothetical protein